MKRTMNLVFGVLAGLATGAFAEAQLIHFDGSELTQVVNLSAPETHPVFEERDVPSTCYRYGVIGYERECRTAFELQCRQVPRQRCVNVPREVCTSTPEQVCQTGPNGQRICHTVQRRQCHTVVSQQCSTHFEQVCENRPVQRCEDVARYGNIPYACTKRELVHVRDDLDFMVSGVVTVNFRILGAGQPNEFLSLDLVRKEAASYELTSALREQAGSGYFILSINKVDERVDVVGQQAKSLSATFDVTLLPRN